MRDDEPLALALRRKLGHGKVRTRHDGGFAFVPARDYNNIIMPRSLK